MKVTNKGIRIILAAVILLLAGMFVWAVFGKLETTAEAFAVIKDGTAQVMVIELIPVAVTADMPIRIDSTDYKISSMEYDEYGRTIMYVPIPLPDGDYDAKIVIETISPISFLLK